MIKNKSRIGRGYYPGVGQETVNKQLFFKIKEGIKVERGRVGQPGSCGSGQSSGCAYKADSQTPSDNKHLNKQKN